MNNTPLNHIAVIPDGNRRWAKEHNLPTLEGHRKGVDTAVLLARKARALGIHTFTIWAFSTENWKRAQEEVGYLMRLYEVFIERYLQDALHDNVRLVHLGRKDRLPQSLLKKISNAEEKTKHHDQYTLNVALDYGGQDEIIRAVKKMAEQTKNFESLDEETFASFLDTHAQPYPNPDLIIRTSGEQRISGFMPWQSAYAEYLFLDKYFPDMNERDMEDAAKEFQTRQRRFGK